MAEADHTSFLIVWSVYDVAALLSASIRKDSTDMLKVEKSWMGRDACVEYEPRTRLIQHVC